MNHSERMLTRKTVPGGEDDVAFHLLREMIIADVLTKHGNRPWSLQGFGMLRTYLGPALRLHIWDPRFRVQNVTEIHDHPWHFTSIVLAGRMRNVRYTCVPAGVGAPATHVAGRIMCGPSPTERDVELGHVRLVVEREEIIGPGESYAMRSGELHASYPDPSTVTLCRRMRDEDRSPDHAAVYWPIGGSRVSAEPRDASPEEVDAIVGPALELMGACFPPSTRVRVVGDHSWHGHVGTVRRVGANGVHHVSIDDDSGKEVARELFSASELTRADPAILRG